MQNKAQTFQFFAGVDIGHLTFVATLIRESVQVETKEFPMNLKGLSSWLDWLASHGAKPEQTLICLEHTGVYSERFELISYGAGYTLWKVSAARILNIQLGPDRVKSDILDSKKIAAFCYRFHDQVSPYLPEKREISQLRQLIQYRKQLVKIRASMLSQQHAFKLKTHQLSSIVQDREESIEHFSQKIEKVEKQMKELLESQAPLKRMSEVLESIPGIGPVTALKLIVVTHGFTKINDHKKLAAHAGTAPYDNSSGSNTKWRKRRISRKADKSIKVLLTTAVMAVIKPGGYFHSFYEGLCKAPGRLKMQAINIIRNKLLKIAVTLINNDQLFNKKTYKNNSKSWQSFLTLS